MAKCCSENTGRASSLAPKESWFSQMIPHCLRYAQEAKAKGKHIVGITCEYTPRELIMAADGVPVCLCGGSAEMIPPAEEHLPANLCPLIKSTYGYSVTKSNPFLEMAELIVAETTCDGKKKMYELLAETRPVYVLELPQKSSDADAFEHWVKELRKLKAELEKRFGVSITDERIRQAIRTMNEERKLRRQLAELMKADQPPLTGRQLLDFKSIISGIDSDLHQYAQAIDLFRKNQSAATHQSVRVLMTGVPTVHGAERVLDLIETSGGCVVCTDNCTGLKPIREDVHESAADPIRALAEKYVRIPCSVMTPNTRRMEWLRDMVSDYRPQCIVDLIWQACLTYDVESHQIRRLAQELGLPYLRIETDYSPSDSARIALRIEALFETVRQQGHPGA
jgi:benzoyl-CoA reductase/2-hydroxyglutaryl-CoA dehydratase subunit BcrC/BadD/HgdB